MRWFASLVAVIVAGLLAGCGSAGSSSSSSSSSTSTSTASAPATTTTSTSSTTAGAPSGGLTLTETEFKITPNSPTVAKTGYVTITIHNSGKITHALAVQTPSGVVKTRPIPPGESAILAVDLPKAGSYTFYCPIDHHRMLGMVGTLKVAGGGASGGSTGGGSASGGAGLPTTTTSSTSPSGGSPY